MIEDVQLKGWVAGSGDDSLAAIDYVRIDWTEVTE
jgi:hypothetical protein